MYHSQIYHTNYRLRLPIEHGDAVLVFKEPYLTLDSCLLWLSICGLLLLVSTHRAVNREICIHYKTRNRLSRI